MNITNGGPSEQTLHVTNCPPSLGLLEHELGHERRGRIANEGKAKNNCPNAHRLNSNALQRQKGKVEASSYVGNDDG